MLKEVILSSLRAHYLYMENVYNFLLYLEDLKTDDSIDGHFSLSVQCLGNTLEHLDDVLTDIQYDYLKFSSI